MSLDTHSEAVHTKDTQTRAWTSTRARFGEPEPRNIPNVP